MALWGWQIICCWGFSISKSASLRAWSGLRGSLYNLTKSSLFVGAAHGEASEPLATLFISWKIVSLFTQLDSWVHYPKEISCSKYFTALMLWSLTDDAGNLIRGCRIGSVLSRSCRRSTLLNPWLHRSSLQSHLLTAFLASSNGSIDGLWGCWQ